jgi:hypothetical protein
VSPVHPRKARSRRANFTLQDLAPGSDEQIWYKGIFSQYEASIHPIAASQLCLPKHHRLHIQSPSESGMGRSHNPLSIASHQLLSSASVADISGRSFSIFKQVMGVFNWCKFSEYMGVELGLGAADHIEARRRQQCAIRLSWCLKQHEQLEIPFRLDTRLQTMNMDIIVFVRSS